VFRTSNLQSRNEAVNRSLGTFAVTIVGGFCLLMTACGGGSTSNPPPVNPNAPSVTVTPATASITTVQSESVKVVVSGSSGTPSGSVSLTSGTYSSAATALSGGTASIQIAAASLAAGTNTLTAVYSPDASSSSEYTSATGTGTVTVTKATPVVTVTPASLNVPPGQDVAVTVAVSAGSGAPTATGSVIVSAGSYTSSATALASASASITVPAASLVGGSNNISAAYTPDSAGANLYGSASGSAPVTVIVVSNVTVNQGVSLATISDKLLGMNMAAWFDPTDPAVVPAFQAIGIKAVRWPGGSWSDDYHWQSNSMCNGTTPGAWAHPNAVYLNIINDLEIPAGLDVALTANYGDDSTCTKGGDPTEAAAWLSYAEAHGGTVGHITIGNEVYGSWESDHHAKRHDPATYATAAATGYYPDLKAVDKNVLVGVVVNPGNQPDWDTIVLSNAKYDFVEYHYYAQSPGLETDQYLVHKAATDLTTFINTLKAELAAAGKPDTPIYLGEIGSVYTNPGKQSWSITQGLYAGQALGEMMNEGVSRLTWWIGFGDCNGTGGNNSASLYGWQNFGAYNVFSDGPTDPTCSNAGPDGTMSPTARAFQLFSNVLVNGESALGATVVGDNADVRAYAATHNGGTAVVLFNLNQTATLPVNITLSTQTTSAGVATITYSKAIYDTSKNNVWDDPATSDLGTQNLPLSLNLDPWSMTVVIIK
jgi:predicted heme/steroid binding protein